MVETTENEERVDFDEENFMEEIDDEEQVEGAGDDNIQEGEEEDGDEEESDESEEDPSEDDENNAGIEAEEHEEKPVSSANGADNEKHAELLALPPHGSEVFIGGLPRDTSEEELRDHCETVGDVFKMRMIKNKDTNESKGYAFVSFTSKDVARKVIDELSKKEFKGKTLRCSLSDSKQRLFMGNIPKNLTLDEFRKEIEKIGPGVENIELKMDPKIPTRNRGFAFIEYYNHACADYSRQKMISGNFTLDGNNPTVTWAEPKSTTIEPTAAASQVKALYVKNIPDNTTTDQIKELFLRHGEITNVVMPPSKRGSNKRDFGFIYFSERSSALKAISDTEPYIINGQTLEIALAKPQAERKPEAPAIVHAALPLPGYLPQPSFGGFPTSAYGSFGTGFAAAPAAIQQPMIYGRGQMPTGMQMVPMVLPNGQIGYVLQQPGMQISPAPMPRINDRNDHYDRNDRGSDRNDRGGDRYDRNDHYDRGDRDHYDRHDRSERSGGPYGRGASSGGDRNRGRRHRPY